MITSKKDYIEYLRCDFSMYYNTTEYKLSLVQRLFSKSVRFILLLRKAEYQTNCYKSKIGKMIAAIARIRLRFHEEKCGYSIPINVLGKGTVIVHLGTVIINSNTKIGDFCRIHAGVNIGTGAGLVGVAPIIGNNVYIGPGAKLFGGIEIADGVAIGANAVVNKSFIEPGISIGGMPAKKISDKGSADYIKIPDKL